MFKNLDYFYVGFYIWMFILFVVNIQDGIEGSETWTSFMSSFMSGAIAWWFVENFSKLKKK